jgi:hypothetical protein
MLVFALPILFGIIWAVGLTKSAISPEFVSEIPQQIIDETPIILEEIFKDAQDPDFISNANTRRWFRTAAEVGIAPRELMRETGLLAWMENELSGSLKKVGDMLRGERRARTISIDLTPLKAALQHEAIDQYLEEILDRLPACGLDELALWEEAYDRDIDWFELPPCRPEPNIALSVFRAERMRALNDMDDEINILEGVRYPPLGISRSVTLFSYGLFIIPALFLFAGAIIAATSPAGFCRWLGISTIAAGLPALVLALVTRYLSSWALHLTPFWETGLSDLEELVLEKVIWIPQLVIRHLFDGVVVLAGAVCIIGLVIFALSFVVSNKRRSKARRTAVQTAPAKAAVAAAPAPASISAPVPAPVQKKDKKPESKLESEESIEKEKVPLPPPEAEGEED